MYELILWMCLNTASVCDQYHNANAYYQSFIVPDAQGCIDKRIEIDRQPDPPNAKSHYKCLAIGEPL